MSRPRSVSLSRFLRDEGGQVLPIVTVMLVVLLGMAGLVIDVGRAYLCHRQLQAATDASALAAAQSIPASATAGATIANDPIAQADAYSALSGELNARSGLQSVTMSIGFPKLKCLSTLQAKGQACVTVGVGSAAGQSANAIEVEEQAIVPMYFAALFGHSTMALSAYSTAAIRGGENRPSNIILIVDSTLSMNATDANCSNLSQMRCALSGIQIFLQNISPCGSWQATCGPVTNGNVSNSFDRVSLFTFPNVSVGTASIDSNCTQTFPAPNGTNGYLYLPNYGNFDMLNTPPFSGVATALPYSFPAPGATYAGLSDGNVTDPTYQIAPFVSDYRTSDSATTLSNASQLVKAVGGAGGCNGMAVANYEGDYETYYAGVLYAAQSALVAEAALNPGTENVMIVLGDGDSNALQSGGLVSGSTGYPNMQGAPQPKTGSYKNADASGHYPSWVGECTQAVAAAQAATAAGTLVYTVAYGSSGTGCGTDTSPVMSPCNTLASMASARQYFYSDTPSAALGSCTASQPVTSLAGIFLAIAADLTEPRLIPNNTT